MSVIKNLAEWQEAIEEVNLYYTPSIKLYSYDIEYEVICSNYDVPLGTIVKLSRSNILKMSFMPLFVIDKNTIKNIHWCKLKPYKGD